MAEQTGRCCWQNVTHEQVGVRLTCMDVRRCDAVLGSEGQQQYFILDSLLRRAPVKLHYHRVDVLRSIAARGRPVELPSV